MIRLTRAGATVTARAPAKLNLFLEVLGKRPDGFHELETLMTTVAIYDHLQLAPHPGNEITLDASWGLGYQAQAQAALIKGEPSVWEPLPSSPNNLVFRVLSKLRELTGEQRGVSVSLVKQIPAAAGLGGASSDAAAALLAGNLFWNLKLPAQQLLAIANSLGSDIAFFMNDTLPAVTRFTATSVARCASRSASRVSVACSCAGFDRSMSTSNVSASARITEND